MERLCSNCKQPFETKDLRTKNCSVKCGRFATEAARRKYTPEQVAKVLELKRQLYTIKQIIDMTGVKGTKVKEIVRDNQAYLTPEQRQTNALAGQALGHMEHMRKYITEEGKARRDEKVAVYNKTSEKRAAMGAVALREWQKTRANGYRQLGNRTAWGYRGANGAIFLTETEWYVLGKWKPARHTHKNKTDTCFTCGQGSIEKKHFEGAHRIPLMKGMANFGLTPDYLNRDENIVTTHNGRCNSKAELTVVESIELLKSWGISSLPSYLDQEVLSLWNSQDPSVHNSPSSVSSTLSTI